MARTTRYFVRDLNQKTSEPMELSLTPLDDGRYAVTFGDQRVEVDALQLPGGGLSLLADGVSWSADFDERDEALTVLSRGVASRFDVADERKLKLRAANAAFTLEGKQVVKAPMPGKVVKILVKAGDEVAEGQGLVVVEAMKMENELKSPKAGKVVQVLTKEGTAVENGAPLLEVE